MWEATTHSKLLSIRLRYLATGNNFTSQSTGHVLTARHTDGNWINITQYCPQTIQYIGQYIVRPFNVTLSRLIICYWPSRGNSPHPARKWRLFCPALYSQVIVPCGRADRRHGANSCFSKFCEKRLKLKICKIIVLPIASHRRETWSLTLREDSGLRVFENRVLRRIFGPKREKVTGGWRKLHTGEIHDQHSSPNIIRVIKWRTIRWAEQVERMELKL